MKKIITLITMFVLSVGFLAAQEYFAYQAVVVDANGNLVVDQTVTANVTITDGNGVTNQQTFNNVHTSLNGLVSLYIDDPGTIDWRTANISVQFTDADATIPNYGPERVAGVPYALQSSDDELTTDMIADYYGRANTTMDDMEAILAALEGNENLAEAWKEAFIDTVINNRPVAKQILLYYLNTGTPDDVQALYNAFNGNDELKGAFIEAIKALVQANRETVYDILRQYALSLTGNEVNAIVDALPDNVKERIVVRAANYVKDPEHKSTLIIPVVMDYMQNITTDEFDALVAAIQNNGPVFQVMLDQFNAWMDDYFDTRFNGGSHVRNVISEAIEEEYYPQCDPAIDLCKLKSDLEAMSTCFEALDELSFYKDNSLNYVAVLPYRGSNPTSVGVTLDVNSLILGSTTIYPTATVDPSAKTITVVVSPNDLPLVTGDTFEPTFTINVECSDDPITIAGDTYTEQ